MAACISSITLKNDDVYLEEVSFFLMNKIRCFTTPSVLTTSESPEDKRKAQKWGFTSDFKTKPYSDIPIIKFKDLNDLFYSYCNGGWTTSAADPKGLEQLNEFLKYTNEALDESEIVFLGPIEQLFIENTEFTTTLITKFGKNPKENTTEYLQFLKEYKN